MVPQAAYPCGKFSDMRRVAARSPAAVKRSRLGWTVSRQP